MSTAGAGPYEVRNGAAEMRRQASADYAAPRIGDRVRSAWRQTFDICSTGSEPESDFSIASRNLA
ncbi:hypothetical protein AMK09_24435 [Streptomyces sp. CB02488]|nr:hypothetical protein AMK09_24435 [Streptomyces sp. CB02488]